MKTASAEPKGGLKRLSGFNIFRLALLAVLIYLLIAFVDLSQLNHLSPLQLLLVFGLIGLYNISQYLFLAFVMETRSVQMPAREWIGLGGFSTLLNMTLPLQSGVAVKAVYFKKIYDLGYRDFIVIQGFFTVLRAITYLGVAALLVSLMPVHGSIKWGAWLVFIASMIPLRFGRIAYQPKQRLLAGLLEAYHFLHDLKGNHLLLGKVLANTLLSMVLLSLALSIILHGMEHPVSFTRAILVMDSFSITGLVNLTPGNMGIQEFVSGLVLEILGNDFQAGLTGILVIRAMSLIFNVVLLPFYFSRFKDYRKAKMPED